MTIILLAGGLNTVLLFSTSYLNTKPGYGYSVVTTSSLTVNATTDDGWIQNTSGVYSTAQGAANGSVYSTNSTFVVGQDPSYRVARGFVFFDTSSIPDAATVVSATLRLYGAVDASIQDFSILIYSGQPSHPYCPLRPQDFDADNYTMNASSETLFTSSFSTTGYVNLTVYPIEINKTGITRLLLWSSRDKNAVQPQSGVDEYVTFYTNEQGSGYLPQLVVTYY